MASPRTKARTKTWNGTGSSDDDESLYAPIPEVEDATEKLAALKKEMADAQAKLLKAKEQRQQEEILTREMEGKRLAQEAEQRKHRYVMYLTSGKQHDIHDYTEEEYAYVVTYVNGGKTRYKRSLVRKIEPIPENGGTVKQ